MNQLFNTVNYFEFQAFEALRKRETSRPLYCASRNHTPFANSYFFLLTSYISDRAWKQKSRRGIPARGGFLIDSLIYARSRESSVGWSITAVAVSP